MSEEFITPTDLAEKIGPPATETKVLEWRRTYGWPAVKFGKTIRFTPEQVEQIIAQQTVGGDKPGKAVGIAGQTTRSAARRRSS